MYRSIRLVYSDGLALFASFLIGTGFFKLEFLFLLFAFAQCYRNYFQNVASNFKGVWYLISFVLILTFLLSYWSLYIPYRPGIFVQENHYFSLVFAWAFISFSLPLLINEDDNIVLLLGALTAGAFVYAAATTILTICILNPPYYGKVIDLRSFLRGIINIGNSPGISNLLCLMPIFFSACIFFSAYRKHRYIIYICLALTVVSVMLALTLEQRTYFIIIIIQPIIIALLSLFLRRYRIAMIAVSISAICLIFLSASTIFELSLSKKAIDISIIKDGRFEMSYYWFENFLLDPFRRIEVGPSGFETTYWFHNFFIDIHRLSGFYSMLSAIMLCIVFFARAFLLFRTVPEYGAFVLAIATPVFLLMLTSVVPEGEKQPFLIIIILYSVCERLLWNKSRKLH